MPKQPHTIPSKFKAKNKKDIQETSLDRSQATSTHIQEIQRTTQCLMHEIKHEQYEEHDQKSEELLPSQKVMVK